MTTSEYVQALRRAANRAEVDNRRADFTVWIACGELSAPSMYADADDMYASFLLWDNAPRGWDSVSGGTVGGGAR